MSRQKKIRTDNRKLSPPRTNQTPRLLRGNVDIESYDYYLKRIAMKRGFSDYTDYLNHFARQRGFSSIKEYNTHVLASIGITSPSQHKAVLAKRLGLESATDYDNFLASQRQGRPRYRKFSLLLRRFLFETKQTQTWLASKTGVDHRLISRYVNGLSYPKADKLDRILKVVKDHMHYKDQLSNSIQ